MFDALVAIGNAIYDLADRLYQAGINLVCSLVNAYISVVQTAVKLIVDAFDAFVTWAMQFIKDTINAAIGSFINTIKNMLQGYGSGVLASTEKVKSEAATGTVSTLTMDQFASSLSGGLFEVLMALSVALILALILLTAVTNVFSFVLGIILSIITVVLMNQVFGAETIPQAKVTVTQDDAKTVVNEDGEVDVAYVRSVQATQDMNNNNNGLGYDIIDIAVSQWVLKIQCGVYALAKTAFGKVSLAIGGCALALAIYGAAIHNSDLKTLAWCMGFVGLCIDFIEMAHALLIDIASIKSKAMETGALVMNFGAMAVSTYMADQG